MANIENIKLGGITYPLRDKNTYRSLSETQEETLLNTGNYNGDFVADGEIFTCADGAFKQYEFYYEPASIQRTASASAPYNDIRDVCQVGDDVYGVPMHDTSKLYKSIDGGKMFTTYNTSRQSLSGCYNCKIVNDNGTLYVLSLSESGGANNYVYVDVCTGIGTVDETWERYSVMNVYSYSSGREISKGLQITILNNSIIVKNAVYGDGTAKKALKSDLSTWDDVSQGTSLNNWYPLYYVDGCLLCSWDYSPDEGETWQRTNSTDIADSARFVKDGKIYATYNNKLYSTDNGTWVEEGNMTLNGSSINPTSAWAYDSSTSLMFAWNGNDTIISSEDGLEWETVSTTFETDDVRTVIPLDDLSFAVMYSDYTMESNEYAYGILDATPIRNLVVLGGGSGVTLTDIAEAGDGISFTSPSEQAFTIEGSGVTITNKIATGFDYDTYIIATASDEIIQNEDFEIGIKVKCNDFSLSDFLGSNDVDEQMKIPYIKIETIQGSGEVTGWFSNSGDYYQSYSTQIHTTDANITEGSWVWIKITGTYIGPDEYKYGIYVSKTGEFNSSSPHVEATDTGVVLQLSKLCLGAAANWSEMYNFDGSIDLNETYVKINNEIVWTPYISAGDKTIINANLVGIAQAGTGITFDDGSSTIQSFTVVGSPIITDGIMSFISTSNYVISNTEFPTTGVCSVLAKFYVGSYSSHQTIISRQDVDKELYIKKETGTLCFYDTQVRDSGLAISSGNTYWAKYTIDQSTKECIIAGILDNGYTKDTLPDDSNWTKVTWTSSEDTFGGNLLSIGADLPDNTSFNSGMIDLNEFYYIQDDLIVWTPYTMTPSGKIAITLDIATNQVNAPTSSDEGYVGKLWITSSGAVYICTGVNGSTYTWTQMNNSGGSSTLAGLSDVDITSPSNGQALLYNGTSQEWNNGSGSSYNESTGILTII